VGDWYTVGLAVGVGVAIGVVLAGFLASSQIGILIACVLAAVAGAAFGLAVFDVPEAVGGAIGGAAGALGAGIVVFGALRRGGTRGGVGALVLAAGFVVCLLALIPVVGYVLAVVLPALGLRLRRQRAERYAGLRTLAK
jgi:hypothetical protein